MPNKTIVDKQYARDDYIPPGYALLNDDLEIIQHSPMIAKWLGLETPTCCLQKCRPDLYAFIKNLVNDAKLNANDWNHDELVLDDRCFECAINLTNNSAGSGSVHLFLSDYSNGVMQKTFLGLAELDANMGSWELMVPSQKMIWSKNLYLIYGLADDAQITFSSSINFFSADSLQRYADCIEACKLATPFLEIFDVINARGQVKKFRISGKPIYNPAGEITRIHGTIQDVTSHWYDSARYNLAIDAAAIGVFEYDHITTELIWNKHMYALYDKPSDQKMSYSLWHDSMHPDDMDIAKTAFISSIKKGQSFSNIFRLVHKDGSVKYIKASAKTFTNQDKKPLKSIGVNIDITTLIEQEDQLAVQRSLSLYNAKLAAIGEMAASIGHEINNPLAIAIGNLELLKDYISKHPVAVPQWFNHINFIDNSLLRIETIVAGLKHLTRDESKEEMLHVNINDLLKTTITLFREIYKKQGVNLIYKPNMDAKHVAIDGHFGELQQVLMNIINNARDAVVTTPVKNISLSANLVNQQVIITVSDTGIGIEKDIQSRIFENFFSEKKSFNAAGLGLAVVKRILADHQGRIEVESSPGEGASFMVYLPVIQVTQSPQIDDAIVSFHLPEPTSTKANFKQINAIVIDDEPLLLDLIAAHLTSFGIHVFSTSDPAKVLDEISTGNYQLLMTDMCMPLCDGLSLVKQVKSISPGKLKYILMTGGITTDMGKNADYAYHALDGILTKPFTRQALLKMLYDFNLQGENDHVR